MTEYIPREVVTSISTALKSMPVVVLTGMRQTGKSTLLLRDKRFRNFRYITFDDFAHLEAAKENPEGIVKGDTPLIIDEAQKCPEIFTAVKRAVDRERKAGQFILSGSANFALLKEVAETLAGRAVYLLLHPFTIREIRKITGKKPFLVEFLTSGRIPEAKSSAEITDEDILLGGMPPVRTGEVKDPGLWFKGFEQTYLERDVRGFGQISNLISFRHLMHLVALRTGGILSVSELARDAKLNTSTATRYLSVLEASLVIYRLQPYLKNRASRLIKSPKIYLSDSGLACFLAGIENLKGHPLRGKMAETFVLQNLMGIVNSILPEAQIYFWNIQGRHEVDFVVEYREKCIAVEIKSGSTWKKEDLSSLRAFLSRTPRCIAGILAYDGEEIFDLGGRIYAVPLGTLIS